MRRGTRWVVVAMASMCALAACTGETADPPTTPPVTADAPSPSATPSPTPTPDAATPPERPDMSQVDAATAEAVATYFLELYPYVYATGDLTEWRGLSHPDCIFCASVITNVEEMVAQGNTASGGEIVLSEVATAQVSERLFDVGMRANQGAGFEYDSAGQTVESSGPAVYGVSVSVMFEAGSWTIRGVDTESAT